MFTGMAKPIRITGVRISGVLLYSVFVNGLRADPIWWFGCPLSLVMAMLHAVTTLLGKVATDGAIRHTTWWEVFSNFLPDGTDRAGHASRRLSIWLLCRYQGSPLLSCCPTYFVVIKKGKLAVCANSVILSKPSSGARSCSRSQIHGFSVSSL